MSTQLEVKNYTEGPIFMPLVKFTGLIMSTMIIQMLYGAADMLIVGRYSTPDNVSAVSTGSQLMMALTMVIAELSMGTTVVLGQRIGGGDRDRCGKIIGAALFFFLLLAAVLTVVMLACAPVASRLLNAPPEAFEGTVSYIRICSAGLIFITLYSVQGGILRGLGDAKMPLVAVSIAGTANIAGDLLLVCGWDMGAEGAAWATVASQALSVLITTFIIRRKGLPFPFERSMIRYSRSLTAGILRIGAPLAIHDFLVGVSFLIILGIVNRFGVTASAGMGIAEKIIGFIMLCPSSFSQSTATFVAQNFGAGRISRARTVLRLAIGISFCCSCVIGCLSFIGGMQLSSIFSPDLQICKASSDYLRAYAIDCLLTSFLFCYIGFLNGCGRTGFVLLQGVIGAFALRVPLSVLFSMIEPGSLFTIALAAPCTTVIQNIICHFYLRSPGQHRLDGSGS